MGNTLLKEASDDLVQPDQIRRLLKELSEVRLAKLREGVDVLDAASTGGGGVALTGVGAMELGEERGFVGGVVDELRYVLCGFLVRGPVINLMHAPKCDRKIGASREQARREQMAEEMANTGYNDTQGDEDDMDF